MSQFLTRLGFEVQGCLTGAEALRYLEEGASGLALIVLDLSLPDVPGDELLDRIIAGYPQLRILICSGYPYNVQRFPERVRFLQKPFLPKMLAQEIDRMLGTMR
jgi:CheY-like chemotaxis protein